MSDHPPAGARRRFDRRQFLGWASSRSLVLGAGGVALLAACGDDDDATTPASGGGSTTTSVTEATEQAEAVVGDVVDFALTSDEWPGEFGFVTMALRAGAFDGSDVWFVRTDTSDDEYATSEKLVHVPKLAPLTGDGLSGKAYVVEPVDTAQRRATFKLSQCYPGSRYFVLDHSVAPAAEMTHTLASPRLHEGPTAAGATGRTNVFMNGVEGPGPMGFQPSAFDFAAGDPAWSPYWDHWMYAWKDDAIPRVLESQSAVFEARDNGELDEFAGTPDMGALFTVNCPVPVLAPNTFEARA